jgi:glycosyltransferase involved in cell wall biosynthesis
MVVYNYYEIDRRVRNYTESLVERGDTVDVIALRWKLGSNKYSKLNGVNVYRIQNREYNEKTPVDHLIKVLLFFIMGSIFILRHHVKSHYDIIHVHNVPDFLVFMGLLPRLLGAKVILDIHDILPEFYSQKFRKDIGSVTIKMLRCVERLSVRFADHVIIANDLWKEEIIRRNKLPARKCSSILNYPNVASQRRPPKKQHDETLTIIYPGTISYHHGVDIAIRAVNIVKRRLPSVKCHIYGRSGNVKYYSFLKQLIDELDLRNNVEMFDPVTYESLQSIYLSCDIGIVPKRGGIFAEQAFSTKIFDYMTFGLPIIASRTKIDEYYFDDSMIMFFEPGNHEDLARCILELNDNIEKRQSLIEHGFQFILKNNWAQKKSIYYEILNELTSSKKS